MKRVSRAILALKALLVRRDPLEVLALKARRAYKERRATKETPAMSDLKVYLENKALVDWLGQAGRQAMQAQREMLEQMDPKDRSAPLVSVVSRDYRDRKAK